jgi:cation diffusion facilitator CzcD-associated flavoprotein CzcO
MEEKSPSIIRLLIYIIVSYIVTIIAILIGLLCQILYWLLFDSFGRKKRRAQRKLKCANQQKDGEYYAIIIGTGFSGLGMAIKLNKLGMDNYILLERYGHVGGTWYRNQYPGCACDVPSNLYSFSFEPNPKWSHYFSRQPEIAEYLEYCTDKYKIRRHIQFNTNVTQLKWIEERQLWQVTTHSNNEEKIFYGRSVVAGSGPLSNASYPTDIPGIDTFKGKMCHTAEWDKTVDFKNKRVAVIGTGASAIQVVPKVHKMGVEQLLVFQRTPPWVIPKIDLALSNWEKNLLKRFPFIQKFIRVVLYWMTECLSLSFVYRWPIRLINQKLVKYNLERQVKDPNLRKKVTPTWDLGCKRMLLTNEWYPTIQKPNVKLVINRIREIKSNSIVTYDGDEYPVDIIIWSTGFQVQKFQLQVYGINGCSLAEQWSETIQVSVYNIYCFVKIYF